MNLGRFQLAERIASGGMGEVFRGVERGWGGVERPVAIKVIAPALSSFPDFVTTFVDEARLSYLLCHANVVQVRDIGKADQTYFIAMEWVDGTDLGSMMARLGQPVPPRYAALVVIDAACGLDYAHRLCGSDGRPLGIVHRDVSPPNILLSWEGEVKLTDFGIARWRERETQSLPGSLKGKLAYMAPEQARGEPLDLRADVFALGVVLYEMATGKNPFTSGATDREMLERVQRCAFTAPGLVAPIAPGLEAIIMRAMAPRPGDRHPTAAALHDDLEGFARREGFSLSAPKLGAFVRHVMDQPAEEAPPSDGRATPVTLSGRPSRPSARKVGQALGAQLAALLGDDDTSASAPPATAQLAASAVPTRAEASATTTPTREAAPPATAARAARASTPAARTSTPVVRAAAPEAPSAEHDTVRNRALRPTTPSLTGGLDVIPRSRTAAWVVLAGVAMLAVLGLLLSHHATAPTASPPDATPRAPTPMAPAPSAPTPTPSAPAPPSPAVAPVAVTPVAAAPKKRAPPTPTAPTRLSVETSPEANVFIDGELIGEAPVHLDVTPGTHHVRVEGSVGGLRLVPKEETVIVREKEHRVLKLELQ